MKRKIIALLLITALGMALLSACADFERAIIGSWECRDSTQDHFWFCELTFTDDGKFVDRDRDTGYWSIDGNALTLDYEYYEYVVTFSMRFSFGELILSHESEDIAVALHRKR